MQNTYAQNKEDLFIAEYFGNKQGSLLSIGENDGITFSNARLLIDKGWSAHLVEPSSVFTNLEALYSGRKDIHCYPLAIGETLGTMILQESGAHVPGGIDRGLVSSFDDAETVKWKKAGVQFTDREVSVFPFNTFWEMTGFAAFDFISIDVEGFEWLILQQMNLDILKCQCLIIEWNGIPERFTLFSKYCFEFGLKLAAKNTENLIFIR